MANEQKRGLNKGQGLGLCFALLLAAVLVYMLFSTPRIGGVDYGNYDVVLQQAGLVRTQWDMGHEAQRYYQRVNEEFDYGFLAYTSLLRPGTPTIQYYIAFTRLCTQPFGLHFSTAFLAAVYILVLALSAYGLVSALYKWLGNGAIVAGVGLLLLFSRSSIVGYLGSLYDQGAVMVTVVAYVALVAQALSMPKGYGLRRVLPALLVGGLLLSSQAQLVVLTPGILAVSAMLIWHGKPEAAKWVGYFLACAVAIVFVVFSSWNRLNEELDVQADAARYLTAFQGLLVHSPAPAADLLELGLDESYLGDIGRSYYEEETAYVHNPRDEAEKERLFEKIALWPVTRMYLVHPQRIGDTIASLENHLLDAENERIRTVDTGETRYQRPGLLVLLDLFFRQGGFVRQTLWMVSAAVALALLAVFVRGQRDGRAMMLCAMAVMMASFTLYLPGTVALSGGLDIDVAKVLFMFFGLMALLTLLMTAGLALRRVCLWIEDQETGLELAGQGLGTSRLWAWLQRTAADRRAVAVGCMALAAGMGAYLLLAVPRAGGINNGDFGRMMRVLGLTWQSDILYNPGEQATKHVIEHYDLVEGLNPILAGYSLAYPSALVRLLCTLTGLPYSTLALSVIHIIVTVLCIGFILWDLHPYLGKATLGLGLLLCMMLMGENYIAWYNSLFGEGSISIGLLMFIACGVHLAVLPRGYHSARWLCLLAFSGMYLCCGKAQMMLALPGVLVLVVGMALYHLPKKKMQRILHCGLCLVLCISCSLGALNLYKINEVDSGDTTIWQAVFYGALMVSDDPLADMEELGIDLKMAHDIGKHFYFGEEDYVYPMDSQEAYDGFFSKVNNFTLIMYYLRHPKYLFKMLDYSAQESLQLHTGFMGYKGQRYDLVHDEVKRFALWAEIRPYFAASAFWQYVIIYGLVVAGILFLLTRKRIRASVKMLWFILLCIMLIGVLQFPMTALGNGFADSNKQLYTFMLCYDIMVIVIIAAGARQLHQWWLRRLALKSEQGEGGVQV